MNSEKYIGLDVHQATISVAVMDSRGKVVMESILETKASTILEFFAGLRGTLSVTFERLRLICVLREIFGTLGATKDQGLKAGKHQRYAPLGLCAMSCNRKDSRRAVTAENTC